jgi:hypothetical protein
MLISREGQQYKGLFLVELQHNGCNQVRQASWCSIKRKTRQAFEKIGGASRARTDDLIVAKDGVCQFRPFACLHLAAHHVPKRSNWPEFFFGFYFKIQLCRESCLNSFSGLPILTAT